MVSMRLFSVAAMAAVAHGHSQILAAYGDSGMAVGFAVEDIARNCTSISPCQLDSTIIRDEEVQSGVSTACGRTELAGVIDTQQQMKDAESSGNVAKVTAGGQLTMTIHQVNADGAGPYTCDVDTTGGSAGATGQTKVTVTNNIPGANGLSTVKTTDFNMTLTMPKDMQCTGGTAGNMCTVRCRNNALAGPFGGCVAVQQTDATGNNNAATGKGNNNNAASKGGNNAATSKGNNNNAATAKGNNNAAAAATNAKGNNAKGGNNN